VPSVQLGMKNIGLASDVLHFGEMPKYHISIGQISAVPKRPEGLYVTAWQDGTDRVLTARFLSWDVLSKEFRRYKVLVLELDSAQHAVKYSGRWAAPTPITLTDEQMLGLKLRNP
jgi:hypothetical protein